MSVLIIAEAGVNHNGDDELAFKLVDEASRAGADIVKFQTFSAKKLATSKAKKASYQKATTDPDETQLEMLTKLELSQEMHFKLVEYCKGKNIEFLTTAFDMESLDFISQKLDLKRLKIPSGELTNGPLVLEYAKTGKELIISTGMATLSEIRSALSVVAFGMVGTSSPSIANFEKSFASDEGQKALKSCVTLLHCTTEYPTPLEEINLNAMSTMAAEFGLPIGYSDHSQGNIVSFAATALGAVVIEKHFTLDRNMEGPDHKASLEPSELADLVAGIRGVEMAMGSAEKGPQPSEIKNMAIARKSLVAKTAIKSGDVFSNENMTIKRPGDGISPMQYWNKLGCISDRDYQEGDLVK